MPVRAMINLLPIRASIGIPVACFDEYQLLPEVDKEDSRDTVEGKTART